MALLAQQMFRGSLLATSKSAVQPLTALRTVLRTFEPYLKHIENRMSTGRMQNKMQSLPVGGGGKERGGRSSYRSDSKHFGGRLILNWNFNGTNLTF